MLLHEFLDFQAQSRGAFVFAECEGTALSFTEAQTRSDQIAAALVRAGLKQGDRFGLLSRNSIDGLLVIYAASRIGAAPVPLNYRLAPREWAEILVDAGAVAVVAETDYCLLVGQGFDELGTETPPILLGLDGSAPGWPQLELSPERVILPPGGRSPDAVLIQIYTSGTTGKPKGACLSHANILADILQSVIATPHKLSPGERALVVLPLFHIAALSTALAATACGGTLVIHRDVDPIAIARALSEDHIAVATLVPAVIQFLLVGVPGLADMKFPDLKLLGYGASPIAEPVLRRAMAVFGCHFAQGYGMTELSGTCCMLTEVDHRLALSGRPDLLLSAGKAMPGVEVCVVGPLDEDLPAGEVGEVVVRGPQVMSGYWNRPEETEAALRGGWMHTGDAGFLDADGYLFIRDRLKDMIVSGAENVYPAEVEAVLYAHPGVADVSVIGVPDARWGETVLAVIVVKSGDATTEQEFDTFCRARLGGFKVPKRYEFVDALPRNAAGKILKRELRSRYWADQDRQVG